MDKSLRTPTLIGACRKRLDMRFVRKVNFYALKLFVANFIQKERRMRSVERLQLAEAEIITLGAFDKADLESWKVSIAVVDDAGVLLSFRKMDGSSNSSVQTAIDKARSSAVTRRPTKFFEEMVAQGRLGASMIDGVFPIEGGLPIVVNGEVVGGVGVSGLKSELDIEVVQAGLDALSKIHASWA